MSESPAIRFHSGLVVNLWVTEPDQNHMCNKNKNKNENMIRHDLP